MQTTPRPTSPRLGTSPNPKSERSETAPISLQAHQALSPAQRVLADKDAEYRDKLAQIAALEAEIAALKAARKAREAELREAGLLAQAQPAQPAEITPEEAAEILDVLLEGAEDGEGAEDADSNSEEAEDDGSEEAEEAADGRPGPSTPPKDADADDTKPSKKRKAVDEAALEAALEDAVRPEVQEADLEALRQEDPREYEFVTTGRIAGDWLNQDNPNNHRSRRVRKQVNLQFFEATTTVKGKEVPLYDDAYMRPVARLRADAPGNWFSAKFACLDPKDGGRHPDESEEDTDIIDNDNDTHQDDDDGGSEDEFVPESDDGGSDDDDGGSEDDEDVEVVCGEGENFLRWGFYRARGELPPVKQEDGLVRVKQEDAPLVRVKQEDGLERAEEEGDSASPRQKLTATHPPPPSVVDLTMDDSGSESDD